MTPFGALIATPARGTLLGNRGGGFHDPETRRLGRRRWASRQWIACVLAFKGRHRRVWGDGYTELFFLDEVTALAAGHRPCFECRRQDAVAFAGAVARGLGWPAPPRATAMDRQLHAERLDGRTKRCHVADLASLPDGAMIALDGQAFAVRDDRLLAWEPAGYAAAMRRPKAATVSVLTPPLVIAALDAGYRPGWHPSADP